jgi:hypothetical protein
MPPNSGGDDVLQANDRKTGHPADHTQSSQISGIHQNISVGKIIYAVVE